MTLLTAAPGPPIAQASHHRIGVSWQDECRDLSQVQFHRSGIFVHFCYQPDAPGIMNRIEFQPGRTHTFEVTHSADATTRKVKYDHPIDGQAHFSQDGRIVTSVRNQAERLDGSTGHDAEVVGQVDADAREQSVADGGSRPGGLGVPKRQAGHLGEAQFRVDLGDRGRVVVLGTEPAISVIGVYVPSRDRSAGKTERKQRFIRTLIEAYDNLPADLREHLVLGGDYNVIGKTHRPLHPGFLPFEFGLLDGLRDRGLADAYEHVAPGEQAYSWVGRTGDSYRYDYLHVAPGLAGLIGTCSYLHETRQLSLTDHAAMTLTLHAAATPLETGNPAGTEATDGALTLF